MEVGTADRHAMLKSALDLAALRNFPRALALLDKCAQQARKHNDWRCEGRAMRNIGAIYVELGKYADALLFLEQGLHASRRQGHVYSEVKCLQSIGAAYEGQGLHERAVTYLEQALELSKQITGKDTEKLLMILKENLAVAKTSSGQYAEGMQLHKESYELARQHGDILATDAAKCRGLETAAAAKAYRTALKLLKPWHCTSEDKTH